MFLGLGQGRDRDQNFSTCWSQLQAGFKFFFLLDITLAILSLFLGGFFFVYCTNLVELTIGRFQIWRLITSFMLPSIGQMMIIGVLFDMWILYQYMPDIEKRTSTAYIILQVFLQIFTCNVALVIVCYPLILMKFGNSIIFMGYGFLPVVFSFMWKKIAEAPDQPTRFCCFPCLIPRKYVPLLFWAILSLFGNSFIVLGIYCGLGYYQFIVRNKSIIQLPLKIYRKFDSLMPESVLNNPGYVKVKDVEQNLRKQCLEGGCCEWANRDEDNVVGAEVGRPDRVEVLGGGVGLGGSNQREEMDFRNYWRQKDENAQNDVQRDVQNNILDSSSRDLVDDRV